MQTSLCALQSSSSALGTGSRSLGARVSGTHVHTPALFMMTRRCSGARCPRTDEGVGIGEHRRCHMAGTRSSMDESQSLSIDARADCGGWMMFMVRPSSFLKTMGSRSSEPKLYAG